MAEEKIVVSVEGKTVPFEVALKRLGLSLNDLNKELAKTWQVADKTGKITNTMVINNKELSNSLRGAAKQARAFKFEYLSVMFAGMALDRAFGGLVRTQLELFGVTSLMGDAWTTVMLPIMDLLTPILYSLIEAFMSMPEGAKLAIGGFVLLMASFGKFLAITGQVALAMMGFKMIGKDLAFNFKATGYAKLLGQLKNIGALASIAFVIVKLKKGDIMGAIGGAMMAAGFYYKNGWLLGAGIVLTLVNEGLMAKWAVGVFDTVGFVAEWISDTLGKALTFRFDKIDWSALSGMFDDMDKIAAEKVLSGEAKSQGLINRMGGLKGAMKVLSDAQNEEIDKLRDNYKLGIIPSQEDYNDEVEKVRDKYRIINTVDLPAMEKHYDNLHRRAESIRSVWGDMFSGFGKSLIAPLVSSLHLPGLAEGGIVTRPTMTMVGEAGPEAVIPLNKMQGVTINQTNNINVSDKYEMEKLIRENNIKLVSEVRRQIAI